MHTAQYILFIVSSPPSRPSKGLGSVDYYAMRFEEHPEVAVFWPVVFFRTSTCFFLSLLQIGT
jgi:hypothetical protein